MRASRASIIGGAFRRWAERAVSRLPYWPDPSASCPAHGERYCTACARHPGDCRGELHVGGCGYWTATGMHWDTCPNRLRRVE